MGLVVGMKDQESEEGQVIDHVTHPMNVLSLSSLHASEMLLRQQDNIKEVCFSYLLSRFFFRK